MQLIMIDGTDEILIMLTETRVSPSSGTRSSARVRDHVLRPPNFDKKRYDDIEEI